MSKFAESSIWRPYTQALTAPVPMRLRRAQGSHLITEEGRRIFDGISSWWVITHGHCHPRISEAIADQAARMDQVIFANFTHEPAEELAELLLQKVLRRDLQKDLRQDLPKDLPKVLKKDDQRLSRVFFSDNGSTAVESALKMALQACAQRGRPEKTKFLTFSHAYHGDTVGAMSVSARGVFTQSYRSTLFEVIHARQPVNSRASVAEFLEDFRTQIAKHHGEIAGVIIEPLIQGAGGMVIWPEEAIREIASLCRQWGVYLIFDEVMTGFGRTGAMFAMNRVGVVPDILCLSKGITGGALPLAATLVCEEIYESFLSKDKTRMLFHGHSFTGNPISCAAAVANIKLFEEEKTLERIQKIEAFNREKILDLAEHLPIRDPRVCGVVAAFDVDTSLWKERPGGEQGYVSGFSETFTRAMLEQEIFMRPLGNIVYLMPPYSTTQEDLDETWKAIRRSLEHHITSSTIFP